MGTLIRARAKTLRLIELLAGELGEDNVRGLYALRDREHDRAMLLAKAGATSTDHDHRVAALWLQAMVAIDEKQPARAGPVLKRLVELDSHVDTKQQASVAADQAVLDARSERGALGIQCQG